MKIYLKSGRRIRINQEIADKIWGYLKTEEGQESPFLKLTLKDKSILILNINDVSYIK